MEGSVVGGTVVCVVAGASVVVGNVVVVEAWVVKDNWFVVSEVEGYTVVNFIVVDGVVDLVVVGMVDLVVVWRVDVVDRTTGGLVVVDDIVGGAV